MSPGLFPLLKRGMVNRSTRFLGLAMMGLWMFVMLGHQQFQRKVAQYQSSSRSLKAKKLRSIGLRKVNYGGLRDKTLVVYVYHESGETYANNFDFFIKNGVGQKANPLIDYVIIINGETKLADFSELLLPNVWIVTRDNSCYDGGAIGQVLEDHPTLWLYKYFVLINSSVRGPFLPHYWPSSLPWTAAFTQLINDRVKLVGTTISCELQVHVQSMLLATDQIGLKALREEGALSCPTSMREAINGYELGSTAAMFKRGYTIDCLMSRYRGVDWSKDPHLRCNNGHNPQVDQRDDGHNVDPFEILFVKVKDSPWKRDAHVVRTYTDYYMGRDDVTKSKWDSPSVQDSLSLERKLLLQRVKRCGAKFDTAYYVKLNPDMKVLTTYDELFQHFLDHGFKERRMYRFEPDPVIVKDPRKAQECSNIQAKILEY